ncbi:PAS domain S-box protein [Salidesulfovibrio onnuriiensis]|uniref:sensor histidine kinase n=1 Tax=Salidesulfovibrio onnuriiensis TaxID=2583823 RepID=UPI0011CB5285|nr:PAS domain S-box protein [Salidesulfovibrio onnuriiensis]
MTSQSKKTKQELVEELTKKHAQVADLEKMLSACLDKEWDVLRDLPIAAYETDPDGVLTNVNNECHALFGTKPNDNWRNKKVTEFIHPDDIEVTFERFNKVQRGERVPGRTLKAVKGDGTMFYVKTYPQVLKRGGKIVGTRGCMVDITEMKEIQEALRKSEERYSLVVQGANDGIWDWDIESDEVYYSPRYKEMLGYEGNEFPNLNQSWLDSLHPDDADQAVMNLNHCLETGEPFQSEFRMRHKNGSWRWILSRGGCLKNKEGKPYRVSGTHTDITARKYGEQALKESEELHNALSRATFEGILISEKGVILAANHAACEMFGASHSEFTGSYIPDFVTADYKEIIRNHIKMGYEAPYEVVGIRKNGTTFPVEFQGKTFSFRGKTTRVTAVRDITLRKQAEERYRALFENALEGVYQSTPEGRFLTMNHSYAALFGYDSPQAMIDEVTDIRTQLYVNPKDRETTAEIMKKHGRIHNYEVQLKKRDGSKIWVSESSRMVYDDKGHFLYYEGFVEDITERKTNQRTTQVLYEISNAISTTSDLQELYATIHGILNKAIDATNFFIALTDEENKKLLFPYHRDEVDAYFTDFDDIEFDEIKGPCLTLEVVRSNKPLFITREESERLEAQQKLQILGTPSAVWLGVPLSIKGRAIGAMAVQHYTDKDHYSDADIKLMTAVSEQVALAIEKKGTEEELFRLNEQLESMVLERTKQLMDKAKQLEEANERLKELDKLKSGLISSISHELRTPLTSIRGFAKLTLKDFERYFAPRDEENPAFGKQAQRIRQNLKIVKSEGERLTRLINDFLDLNRIESGRMEWNDEWIAPGAVARAAHDSVMGQFAEDASVHFSLDVADGLPEIYVDPDRMQQVLINLLHNAHKFTEKGEVRITVKQKGGVIRFIVSDTGIGIPEKDQKRIFEKFQKRRHGDTLSGAKEGTGLGLAICRELINRYGGEIWVESLPGKGSDFIFDIPIKPM